MIQGPCTILGPIQRECRRYLARNDHIGNLSGQMGQEIDSLQFNKKTDFCVPETDPLTIDPMDNKDIHVWGAVLDGEPNPA